MSGHGGTVGTLARRVAAIFAWAGSPGDTIVRKIPLYACRIFCITSVVRHADGGEHARNDKLRRLFATAGVALR